MKTKMLTKIVSLVVINGLTAILVFQINFSDGKNSPIKAQPTEKYSAIWTVTACRVAVFGTGLSKYRVPIGPAGWKVDYTLADGSTISETWEATDWNDYIYGNSFNTVLVNDRSEVCSDKQGYVKGRAYTSGMYSASGDADTSTWSVASIPTKWKMTQL